jgi:hypothetical protein
MDAGFINCSVPVLASAPTAANHLTTRTYVEDNFVDKTTAQTITGEKTLSSNLFVTKATATISLKAVGNTVPTFNMFQDANAVMQMFYIGNKVNATTDHIRWVLNANTGAENTFRLYHNRATFVNEVQGVAATSSTGFVTLAQVQALIAAEHP